MQGVLVAVYFTRFHSAGEVLVFGAVVALEPAKRPAGCCCGLTRFNFFSYADLVNAVQSRVSNVPWK